MYMYMCIFIKIIFNPVKCTCTFVTNFDLCKCTRLKIEIIILNVHYIYVYNISLVPSPSLSTCSPQYVIDLKLGMS